MPNNPSPLKQKRRRYELLVLSLAKQDGEIDEVAKAIIRKHPDKAREKGKEKELALGK